MRIFAFLSLSLVASDLPGLRRDLKVYKRANKRKVRLLFNFITGIVISVVNLVLLII